MYRNVCESVRAHTRSRSHRRSRIHLTWCFLSHIPKATSYLAENDTRYNNLCIFSSRALCIYSFLNLILFFLRAHSLLSAFFCTLLVFRCGANHLLYAFLLKTKKSSENGRESNSSKKIRTKFIVCTSSISMICCCCFLYAMHFTTHTHLHAAQYHQVVRGLNNIFRCTLVMAQIFWVFSRLVGTFASECCFQHEYGYEN